MNYSTTYIAVIVNILSVILPKIGVEIGTDSLTTTAQTVIAIATGLWILFKRYQQGDITPLGRKK